MKRRTVYWLIPAVTALVFLLLAIEGRATHLGNLTSTGWLNVDGYGYDTLKSFKIKPDSVHVTVYNGNTSNGYLYFATTGADPVASAWFDSALVAGDPKYWINLQVADIDGDSTAGLYTILIDKWYQTKSFPERYTFFKVDSSFNFALMKAARDSSILDGSTFAGLNSIINTTNIAENAISGAKIAPSAAATIAYYCRDSVKVVVNDSIMPHLYSLLAAGGGLWPIIGGPILIDAAGSSPTTRFVIDTTSLLAYSSSGYGLIRKVFIIHKAGSQVVPFTVTSVRFNTSGSCTLYTDRTMPFSFAANDTIWPTGLPWEYFASIEEQSLSNWDEAAVNHTTPGTYGYDLPAQIATRSTFDPLADTVTWVDSVISSIGATSGSGTGAYACTLYVRDVGTAIPSAIIQVNNADETASLASHQADGNGRWIFNLDSGYVNVRIHYPNATQGTNPQSVHVTSAGANDTIQITILEGLKTLFLMTLQDNQGALSGAYVQFELLNVPKGDIAIDTTIGSALTGTKFVTNANAGGVISQELFRNCNIKFARSGEFNKTEWLVKAVRLGRSLENPDLEFKFKISSNDSTYFRPSGD